MLRVLPWQLWLGRRAVEAIDHIAREWNHLRLLHVQLVANKPSQNSRCGNFGNEKRKKKDLQRKPFWILWITALKT